MMKRILCLVMCMALITITMLGCTNGTNKQVKTETNGAANVPVKQTRQFVIFSPYSPASWPTDPKDEKGTQELIKRTGIDFKLELVPAGENAETKLNLKIASGNIPDYFYTTKVDTYRKWAEQGVIMQLDDLLAKYGKEMMKWQSKDFLDMCKIDGKLYTFGQGTRPEPGNSSNVNSLCVRWDWVQKLGFQDKLGSMAMGSKTNGEQFTLEDYHDLLAAITQKDPDGNGKNDTIGLSASSNMAGLNHVFGAYGIMPGQWVLRNGKVVRSEMTTEYKQAVELLAKWYKEGLVDKDFPVLNPTQFNNKVQSGSVGSWNGNAWNAQPTQAFYMNLKKNIPNGEITVVTPPKGPNGKRGSQDVKPGGSSFYVISSTCPQPELLVKLIDYTGSDEGHFLCDYGIEGVTYNYDKQKNLVTYIAPYDNLVEVNKLGYGNPTRLVPIVDRRWVDTKTMNELANAEKYFVKDEFYGSVQAMSDYAGIDTQVLETTMSVIVGQQPIDAIDAMQKKWYSSGGQKIEDQVNEEWKKIKK